MDRHEAESKLKHYHDKYGDLVYAATPQALREHARDFRLQAKEFPQSECEQSLLLLVQAVQYESVAQCRIELGENWVSPIAPKVEVQEDQTVRSMSAFRKRHEKTVDAIADDLEVTFTPDEKSGILASAEALLNRVDEEMEPEFFTLVQLTQEVPKPRFKIGDPCWVCDWGDDGKVEGYVAGTVTGIEWYPDEIFYMIGFLDEVDGLVTTNFESVGDDEIFHEMPHEVIQPGEKEAKAKKRSHLSVVK